MSSVACFAGGHRTMYNRHLERLDTHFRKLCRSIVGPPPGTDWTVEWHEILHQWNVRMNIFLDRANIKTWSHICCLSYYNTSPLCRKNVGFDEFYGGAQLEDIGRVDHIFIGSRSLNLTAGKRAWGGGLRSL